MLDFTSHSTEWFFIAQSSAIPTPNLQILMLGFNCGWSTTYGRLKMPVKMIELEEVRLVETTDEALEVIRVGIGYLPPSTPADFC